jgi:two-component system response regulator NreC
VVRIVLADDHQLILDGLKSLIEKVADFRVVAEARNGKELIDVLSAIKADVALVDIDMPVLSGIDAMKELKQIASEVKCIALTMHKESGMVQRALQAGASGYLLKNTDQDKLIAAIRSVMNGEKILGEGLKDGAVASDSGRTEVATDLHLSNELTDRELEVLKMIARGMSNKEIGEALFISHRTVDTHRTNLMKKLNVHNIAGLIRYAIRSGYVE